MHIQLNRVNRNIIHVGLPTDNTSLNDALVKYEGIAIRKGTGWQISENEITGYIPHDGISTDTDLPYAVGVSVAHTLSPNEEVYRNFLHDLNWGFVANGSNNGGDAENGLRFICNENDGNLYDFVVANVPGSSVSSEIGEVQIDYPNVGDENPDNKAAGNKFSQDNSNFYNDFWNESQPEGMDYHFYPLIADEELESYNNDVVEAMELLSLNSCASEIELINGTNYTNWLDIRDFYRINWLNTRFVWKSLIDNGDTESLKEQVENSFGTDTWTEREKLLNISPYVSRSVLEAAANNTILFPHPIALEIFLANPDVLQDKLFIELLMEKTDPMPEYMIEILMNASNQSTIRTILEDEMRSKRSHYLDAAQKILRYDLQNISNEEIIEELNSLRTLPATYMLLDDMLDKGNFVEADSLYSVSPDYLGLGRFSMPDFESYYPWFDLSQRISLGGFDLDNLPPVIVADIEQLAIDYPNTYSGMKAMSLLNFFYGSDLLNEVNVPELEALPKSRSLRSSKSIDDIQAYPIPADQIINLVLSLKDTRYLGGEVQISTIQGVVFYTQKITRLDEQMTINSREFPTGLYVVTLIGSDSIMKSIKLEIIH